LSALPIEKVLEREASLEPEAPLEPVLLLFALQERLFMFGVIFWFTTLAIYIG
jgi:hypothetical protein